MTETGADHGAVDVVWALVTWHPAALLVEERGYGEAELTGWLETLLTALLSAASAR